VALGHVEHPELRPAGVHLDQVPTARAGIRMSGAMARAKRTPKPDASGVTVPAPASRVPPRRTVLGHVGEGFA